MINRSTPYLISMIVIIFLCWPLLSTGGWLAGDIIYEFYYNRTYGFSQIKNGEIPLWNPYQFTGYPFHASLQAGLFYPLNIVFICFSVETALMLTVLLHLFLAWWFMFLLLKQWFNDKWGAFAGGMVYMLGAPCVAHVYAGHITFINAYPWLPLILYFFKLALIRNNIWLFIFGGAVIGVQMLSGYPQLVLFSLYILFIYCIYHMVTIWRNVNVKQVGGLGLKLLVSGLVTLLICAIQLIPTLFFNQYSGRSQGVTYDFASSFSMPPENILTFLYPSVLGDGVNKLGESNISYWGRWLIWEILPYVGLLPFVFFVTTFFTTQKKALILSLLCFITFLAAMGQYGYVYEYLYQYLPGFSLFRVPGRLFVPMCFGLCLLLAFQYHKIGDIDYGKAFFGNLFKVCLFLIICSLFLVLMICGDNGGNSIFWQTILAFINRYEDARFAQMILDSKELWVATYENVIYRILVGISLLTMIMIMAFLFYKGKLNLKHRYLLVVFLCLDLMFFSHKYFIGKTEYENEFPHDIASILKDLGPQRIASKWDVQHLSIGSLSKVPHVGGYDPAQLRVYSEFVNGLSNRAISDELVVSEPIQPGNLLPLMGVKYILVKRGLRPYPGAQLIKSVDDVDLYQLKRPLNRAYFVKGYKVEKDVEKRIALIKEPIMLSERVILNEELNHKVSFEVTDDTIEWLEDKPHHISLKLNTNENRLLVLTDAFYPLWDVYINGNKGMIFPVNHMFRGVVVPKGASEVTFSYNKMPFYMSAGLTLLGLVILLFSIGMWLVERRSKDV